VESGLAAGDKILLDGVQTAKDDQQIEYTYADPKATLSSLQLIRQ
jgi:membrane fusion protein (multidrug efflux system)